MSNPSARRHQQQLAEQKRLVKALWAKYCRSDAPSNLMSWAEVCDALGAIGIDPGSETGSKVRAALALNPNGGSKYTDYPTFKVIFTTIFESLADFLISDRHLPYGSLESSNYSPNLNSVSNLSNHRINTPTNTEGSAHSNTCSRNLSKAEDTPETSNPSYPNSNYCRKLTYAEVSDDIANTLDTVRKHTTNTKLSTPITNIEAYNKAVSRMAIAREHRTKTVGKSTPVKPSPTQPKTELSTPITNIEAYNKAVSRMAIAREHRTKTVGKSTPMKPSLTQPKTELSTPITNIEAYNKAVSRMAIAREHRTKTVGKSTPMKPSPTQPKTELSTPITNIEAYNKAVSRMAIAREHRTKTVGKSFEESLRPSTQYGTVKQQYEQMCLSQVHKSLVPTRPVPFTLVSEQRSKQRIGGDALFILEVDLKDAGITNGLSSRTLGRITVHKGDRPGELAANFCHHHGINKRGEKLIAAQLHLKMNSALDSQLDKVVDDTEYTLWI